jgi:hypothetical protein
MVTRPLLGWAALCATGRAPRPAIGDGTSGEPWRRVLWATHVPGLGDEPVATRLRACDEFALARLLAS